MVVLALDLLGVKVVRRVVPSPPVAWSRAVRRSGRWGNGVAPGLLGLATVLIPCGDPEHDVPGRGGGLAGAGAAIMAVFVLGSVPLFAVIGCASRRSSEWLRGRLGVVAGAAVLVAGLLAINTGLVLNGSSSTLPGAFRSVTGSGASAPVAAPPVGVDGLQRIVIGVHDAGYSPSSVTAGRRPPPSTWPRGSPASA